MNFPHLHLICGRTAGIWLRCITLPSLFIIFASQLGRSLGTEIRFSTRVQRVWDVDANKTDKIKRYLGNLEASVSTFHLPVSCWIDIFIFIDGSSIYEYGQFEHLWTFMNRSFMVIFDHLRRLMVIYSRSSPFKDFTAFSSFIIKVVVLGVILKLFTKTTKWH